MIRHPSSRSVGRVSRQIPRYQFVTDVVVAAAFTLIATLTTLVPWRGVGSLLPDESLTILVAVALTLVFGVALALRRRAPGIAVSVAWAAAFLQMAGGLPPLPGNIAIFGILYTTAAYGTRFVFWVGFASSLAGGLLITVYLLAPLLLAGSWSLESVVGSYLAIGITTFAAAVFALLLSWTVGALARTAMRARTNRAAQELAEAETAAEQERVRIARDMHDVVAHSLAVVIAQADGARYAAEPAVATAALGTISTTARSALADVRMLLTQLRHAQAPGPQPRLADLEALYAQVRAAGIDLRVDVDPAPQGAQPASVELAVYRILQEALTNALRHGRAPVELTLAWRADRVDLSVRNPTDAPARADPARGHGLIGMRERAHLVGGTLEAGATHGAFVVRAQIPIVETS